MRKSLRAWVLIAAVALALTGASAAGGLVGAEPARVPGPVWTTLGVLLVAGLFGGAAWQLVRGWREGYRAAAVLGAMGLVGGPVLSAVVFHVVRRASQRVRIEP
jgi:hypothetical protein